MTEKHDTAAPETAPRHSEEVSESPAWSSLSSQRAKAALDWVEKQIQQLVKIILTHGTHSAAGQVSISFGKLFLIYEDISSSLVGILLRAKQRNIISYNIDEEMLYQSCHSAVPIILLDDKRYR